MSKIKMQKQNLAMESTKIQSFFKKYLQFMNIDDNIPPFKVTYVDSRQTKGIDYSASVNLYKNPLNLNINLSIYDPKSRNSKATLFHEFTHILDYYTYEKYLTTPVIKQGFKLYSEYHATQIEMIYKYNLVENIAQVFDITDIYKDDLMKDIINITDLITTNRIWDNYVIALKKYKKHKTFETFDTAKVAYMYSLGVSNVIRDLTQYKTNKMFSFIEDYDEQYKQIFSILDNYKYNIMPSIEDINKIGQIDNQATTIFTNKIQNQI